MGKVIVGFGMAHVKIACWKCATQRSLNKQQYATLEVKQKLEIFSVIRDVHHTHVNIEVAKEKLKEKWWVVPELFRIHNRIKVCQGIIPRRLGVLWSVKLHVNFTTKVIISSLC